MKKIFFLSALALGLMTSCSEEDITSITTIENNVIVFATNSGNRAMTRSGETISFITDFTVNAVGEDNTAYFSGVKFDYNAATGVFTSNTSYYWPLTGSLSFYSINYPGTVSYSEHNVPRYIYENWNGETDLVAATVIAGEKAIPYPLTFQHVLSQVSISAEAMDKTEQFTYKLMSVEMETPCNGTYCFAETSGGYGAWEINNSSAKVYSFNDALPLTFNESGSVTSGSTYWDILPVKDGKIRFKVGYQVFQNNKLIADFTGDKAKECFAMSPNLVSGKRYVYNFKLTRGTNDAITFSTSLLNWNDAEEPVNLDVPDNSDINVTTPKPIAGSTTSITTVAGVDLYESEEYEWNASYTSNELALLAINTNDLAIIEGQYNYADVDIDGVIYKVKVVDYLFEPIKMDNGDTIEIRIGTNRWYVNCCGESYMQKSQSAHTVKLVGCTVKGIDYKIECN